MRNTSPNRKPSGAVVSRGISAYLRRSLKVFQSTPFGEVALLDAFVQGGNLRCRQDPIIRQGHKQILIGFLES